MDTAVVDANGYSIICHFKLDQAMDLACIRHGRCLLMRSKVAQTRLQSMPIPRGKYDAGFTNCDFILSPYRGTRYHLKEWERSKARPKITKEVFNLRHAQLRNIVERVFGVLKERFKILTLPRFFKIDSQVKGEWQRCVSSTTYWSISLRRIYQISLIKTDINTRRVRI